MEFWIDKEVFRVRRICAMDWLEAAGLYQKLRDRLATDDMEPALLEAVCENAVLGYLSIYDGEKRRFSSPEEALRVLSLDELATVYDCQLCLRQSHGEESVVNERFQAQCAERREQR